VHTTERKVVHESCPGEPTQRYESVHEDEQELDAQQASSSSFLSLLSSRPDSEDQPSTVPRPHHFDLPLGFGGGIFEQLSELDALSRELGFLRPHSAGGDESLTNLVETLTRMSAAEAQQPGAPDQDWTVVGPPPPTSPVVPSPDAAVPTPPAHVWKRKGDRFEEL